MNEEEKNYIIRDSEQTKHYIWEAYGGYLEHFGNYVMYKKLGYMPLEITSGLYKYTIKFYYQIKNKYEQFIKKEDQETAKNKLKTYSKLIDKEELEKQDYYFIMDFIEEFMDKSGIKNITFKEENPSNAVFQNR